MNDLMYNGNVHITLGTDDTIIVNNTGTIHLGRVITKALAGYSITNEIPKFLDIYVMDSNSNYRISLLNRKLPFTGIMYNNNIDDTQGSLIGDLKLHCIVLHTNKTQNSVSNGDVRFGIYNSKEDLLAEVISTNLRDVYNGISDGTDCIVDWTMSFYNSHTEPITQNQ